MKKKAKKIRIEDKENKFWLKYRQPDTRKTE